MSQEVVRWKEKVRDAFEAREKLYSDSKFREFEQFLDNTHARAKGVTNINLIQSIVRRLIAQVYFRNPHMVAKALDKTGEWKVPIIGRLWNTKMRQLGLKRQARMEVQDTFTCGWGVMKLGYDSEFAVAANAKFVSENEIRPDDEKPTEYNRIAPGSPYWLRVHPANVAFQRGRRDVESCRWAVQRYGLELSQLKKDKRFKNTRKLTPDAVLSKSTAASDTIYTTDVDIPNREGVVLLYEIRDLHEGKMYVTAANQHNDWLYNEVDEITRLIERQPFYPLIFNPLSNSPYGCSTVDLLLELQKEFNDIRSQDMAQRRVSILKILAKKGVLSEKEMEMFISEQVAPVIEIDGAVSDENLRVFQAHQGMDMQIAAENTRRDMREVAGVGRAQAGENVSGRHTAAEMRMVQQAFDVKSSDYRSIVSDHIVDLLAGAHRIIAGRPGRQGEGFWTDERIIDVLDEMGREKNVPFKGTDLVGDFDFLIDVESAPPLTTQQLQSERVQVYAALAQNPRINQSYLLKWTAEPFEGLDAQQLIIPEERYIQAQQQALQAQGQVAQAGRQQDEQSAASERQDKLDAQLAQAAVTAAAQPPPAKAEKK